jgi:hypothetical protein
MWLGKQLQAETNKKTPFSWLSLRGGRKALADQGKAALGGLFMQ